MFSKRLKLLREERKISQAELGKALNITQQTVNHYETGKRKPDQDMLESIADYFNVSIDWILGRSDDPKLRQITDTDMLKELEEARKAMDEAADRYLKILEKHSVKKEISPDRF